MSQTISAEQQKGMTILDAFNRGLIVQVDDEFGEMRGLRNALDHFAKSHDATAVAAYEKRFDAIERQKDVEKRSDLAFELQQEIIRADLKAREQSEPGSTWQEHVELALEEMAPKRMQKLRDKVAKAPTAAEFADLKKAFLSSQMVQIDYMSEAVPKDKQQAFIKEAQACCTNIATELFDPQRKPSDPHHLGKVLVAANTKALQQLTALKRNYPANPTPDVRVQDGKVVVTKAAPKVESLVLQGGGGKGVGYPPMLEEMEKSGMLASVDLLVGTSIGALNASCLACGGLADERQILELKTFQQGYDAKGFKKAYPDISFGTSAFPSCAGEMAKIDELTAASIADKLADKSEQDIAGGLVGKLSQLDDATLKRLGLTATDDRTLNAEAAKLAAKIKNQDFAGSDRTAQMVTFKDLALLHQLDPVNFKELTITGWEGAGENGKLVYFNAQQEPDMPIAVAARISMGLPIFAPIKWQGRGPFYDGGFGSNAPVEAAPGLDKLYKDKNPADVEGEFLEGDIPLEVQQAMAKTVLMTFDEDGKADNNLFHQGRETAAPSFAEKKSVGPLNPGYANTIKGDATKAYNTGVNTLEVYHGNAGTLSIGPLLPDAAQTEYAESVSRMKGLQQLERQQDRAVAMVCGDADEALTTLSDDEIKRLVADNKQAKDSKESEDSEGEDSKSEDSEGADDEKQAPVKELLEKCKAYLALKEAFNQRGGDVVGMLDNFAKSLLCSKCVSDIKTLSGVYQPAMTLEDAAVVRGNVGTAETAIKSCPPYLQGMLKQAVLIPMQQRLRGMAAAAPAREPSFAWARDFSSQAFNAAVADAAKAQKLMVSAEAVAAGKALADFEKAMGELAGMKRLDRKKVSEKTRATLTQLEEFQGGLRVMMRMAGSVTNPTMMTFLGWMDQEASRQVTELRSKARGRDADHDFGPYSFNASWDRSAWANVKKKAVESGALEDTGSSGLGEAMEAAVKAAKAWQTAPIEDKDSAARAAFKGWDDVIRAAKWLQRRTECKPLLAYLQGCVNAATIERTKYAAS
jgi:predicted acylesterase/phospholipase RssA